MTGTFKLRWRTIPHEYEIPLNIRVVSYLQTLSHVFGQIHFLEEIFAILKLKM